MTITRDGIVAEAKSWVGTPFVHQARVKGRGCDCLGLVIGALRELGLDPENPHHYATFDPDELKAGLDRNLTRVWQFGEPEIDPLPGMIGLFAFSKDMKGVHLGFLCGDLLVQANSLIGRGRVVEHRWFPMRKGLVALYDVPGVA